MATPNNPLLGFLTDPMGSLNSVAQQGSSLLQKGLDYIHQNAAQPTLTPAPNPYIQATAAATGAKAAATGAKTVAAAPKPTAAPTAPKEDFSLNSPTSIARSQQSEYQNMGVPGGDAQLTDQFSAHTANTSAWITQRVTAPIFTLMDQVWRAPAAAKEFFDTGDLKKSLGKLVPEGYEQWGIKSTANEYDTNTNNSVMFATMQVPSLFRSIKNGVEYWKLQAGTLDEALGTLKILPGEINFTGSNVLKLAREKLVAAGEAGKTTEALGAYKTLYESPLAARIQALTKKHAINPEDIYKGFIQDLSRPALPAPPQTIARKGIDSVNNFLANPLKWVQENVSAGLSIKDVSKEGKVGIPEIPGFNPEETTKITQGEKALQEIMAPPKEYPEFQQLLSVKPGEAKEAFGMQKLVPELAPVRGQSSAVQEAFSVNQRRNLVGKELANKAAAELKDIPLENSFDLIKTYQAGGDTGFNEQIKTFFDKSYQQAATVYRDVPYRQNYLPQMYAESPEKIQEAVAHWLQDTNPEAAKKYVIKDQSGALKLSPSFTKEKVFPDYATAEQYGLTPKYKTIQELAGAYHEDMYKAFNNKVFLDDLLKTEELSLNKTASANTRVSVPQFENYFATPKVAKLLEGLYKQDPSTLDNIAHGLAVTAKGMQEVALSGGVRNINFWSIGQLFKNFTTRIGEVATGHPISGVKGAVGDFADFIRANSNKSTAKELVKYAEDVTEMAAHGVDVSNRPDAYKNLYKTFSNASGWKDVLGMGFNKVFNEAPFTNYLGLEENSVYKQAKAAFLSELSPETAKLKTAAANDRAAAAASEAVKNYFGTLDNVGRSPGTQDAITAAFFAPRFRESMVGFITRTAASVSPQNWFKPEFTKNRQFLVGAAITYGLYDYMNTQLNDGKHLWENPSGREFSLSIPYKDENGKTRYTYLEYLPSVASLPRTVISGQIALIKGDLKTATQKGASLLSMPLQIGSNILNNQDYFGNEIYSDKDDWAEKAKKIAAYTTLQVNHPYVRATINLLQNAQQTNPDKKVPIWEIIVQGLELPLKFKSQAQVDNSSKETSDIYKMKADLKQESIDKNKEKHAKVDELIAKGDKAGLSEYIAGIPDEKEQKAQAKYAKEAMLNYGKPKDDVLIQKFNTNEALEYYKDDIDGMIKSGDKEGLKNIIASVKSPTAQEALGKYIMEQIQSQ